MSTRRDSTTDKRQKNQYRLAFAEESRGAAPMASVGGTESELAKRRAENPTTEQWMEEVCERENCKQALRRVKANIIVLNELDQELERRGHRFARYADDCNIYVRSRRAGERVMASVEHFLTCRLKLRVNAAKSAVDQPEHRKFLGFSFKIGPVPRRRIAHTALARF